MPTNAQNVDHVVMFPHTVFCTVMLDVKFAAFGHPAKTSSAAKSAGFVRFWLFRTSRLEPLPPGVARKLSPSRVWSDGLFATTRLTGGHTVFWKVDMFRNAVFRTDSVPKVLR